MLRNRNNLLSLAIFSLGAVIALYFLGMAAWAGLEASMFASAYSSDERLYSLRCPIILTEGETGTIRAQVKNPIERPINTRIRASISDGYVTLLRQEDQRIALQPEESSPVEWQITSKNAVYNRFVLVRVYQFRNYPVPSHSATCGVLVSHISWLSGAQLFILMLVASLILMGLGSWLWRKTNRPLDGRAKDAANALTWLGRTATLGVLSVFINTWFITGLLFVVSVLMVVVMLAFFIQDA